MAEQTPLAQPEKENTLPVEPATPANKPEEAPVPSASQGDNRVKAELEGEVERLKNELARRDAIAKTAQRQERINAIEKKKLEKQLEQIREGNTNPNENNPVDETATEREVRLTARIKIQNLLLENSEYQELVKQDITLREVLKNNPFALINDYLDAEDAVDQLKEMLDSRVASLKVQPKEAKKEGEPAEFNVGPTQLKDDGKPAPQPNTPPLTLDEKLEQRISSKIRVV